MGDPTGGQPQVDNPALAALKSLRSDLAKDVETYRGLLKSTASDMGGKKVWTGKAATAWEQGVTHHRSHLTTLVNQLLPIVDAEIARTPAKVTQAEAKQWNMSQRFYT